MSIIVLGKNKSHLKSSRIPKQPVTPVTYDGGKRKRILRWSGSGCLILQCQVTLGGGFKKYPQKVSSVKFITRVGLEEGCINCCLYIWKYAWKLDWQAGPLQPTEPINNRPDFFKQQRKSQPVQEPTVSPSQLGLLKALCPQSGTKNTLQSKQWLPKLYF